MSFDARSLERLQQLGRSLPKPLPKPEAETAPQPASQKRHRVETETDPQALFRELMQVSPDGSVPPHLLDRLRQAETDQQRVRQLEQRQTIQRQGAPQSQGLQPRGASNELRPNRQRRPAANGEELELYRLSSDPLESTPLELPDERTALLGALERWRTENPSFDGRERSGPAVELPQQTREELEALGYIEE